MSERRLHSAASTDAARVARLCMTYGLAIHGYEVLRGGLINTNVKVTTETGPVLLRIYIPERTHEQIDFEMSVLEHLQAQGLAVQRPHRTVHGQLFSSDRDQRFALLDFVDGRPMDQQSLSDQIAVDIGSFVARMHHALEGFQPRGARPHADVDAIDRQLGALGDLEDGYDQVRDLWPGVRDHFRGRDLRQGVVHADIYPGNVIVDDCNRLQAVIDFDDCYWGTMLFDLAIATMAFSFVDACGHDWRRAGLVIAAYESVHGRVNQEDLYLAMVLNCVRFYVYTVSLTRAEGQHASQNPFAQRAVHLMDATTQSQFSSSRNA